MTIVIRELHFQCFVRLGVVVGDNWDGHTFYRFQRPESNDRVHRLVIGVFSGCERFCEKPDDGWPGGIAQPPDSDERLMTCGF